MLFRIATCFALGCGLLTSNLLADAGIKSVATKSKIEFVGKKSDGQHSGGFKDFEALANVVDDSPEKSTLKITIKTDSLFSDDERLTGHLKNPDFFDVKKHPTITFESTKIAMDKEDPEHAGTITGKLTMLGHEESLEVPVEVDADEEEINLVAKFKLDRTKWGMVYGEGKIDKEVEITATLHFDR
jgi:polyisoprenoid-binding protein YceI